MARSVRNHASTGAFSFGTLELCTMVSLMLACLFSLGCNNGRQLQADLYQRELRLQEDKIYQLQDCVEEYQAIIRGYRMEVSELRSNDLGPTNGGHATKSIKKNSTKILPLEGPSSQSSTLPELEFRSPNETDSILEEAPDFKGDAPLFEPDAESLPMPDKAAEVIEEEAPLFVPQSYDDAPVDSPLVILSGTNTNLNARMENEIHSKIELDKINEPALSGSPPIPGKPLPLLKSLGKGFVLSAREEVGLELRNGSPEPSGGATLLATLHLFTESCVLADFVGELSFMLADQQLAGRPNRIARWDFSPSEVQQAWKLQQHAVEQSKGQDLIGKKQSRSKIIELPLLLPNRLPTDRTLEMWVRVVEPSGKKRLTKIEAEFLSNPLRLINAEPLAQSDEPRIEQDKSSLEASDKVDSVQVSESQWRRARADRLEATTPEVQQVIFEQPKISAGSK